MTIEPLSAIKADAKALRAGLLDMADKVSLVEAGGVVVPAEVDVALGAILVDLGTVLAWVEQAIEGGTEEPELTAMQNFLNELKAVFDKYSAVLERLDGAGYGLDYGSSGSDVIQFTIADPTTGEVDTKIFTQVRLTSADLV